MQATQTKASEPSTLPEPAVASWFDIASARSETDIFGSIGAL